MADLQRVLDLLHEMTRTGLTAARQLLCAELHYPCVDEGVPAQDWPAPVRQVLAADPVLLARCDSEAGVFDIVHVILKPAARDHGTLLSVAAERLVVEQVLPVQPYTLFLFSDVEQRRWHFVSPTGEPPRAVLRRISVESGARLRIAAERVAMLDVALLRPDALTPLAIRRQHDAAFDVEQVARAFFAAYRRVFEQAEGLIQGLDDRDELRLFTQRLFNRLLFTVFVERKGWLTFNGRTDYLRALWEAAPQKAKANFYRDRLDPLFFSGLSRSPEGDGEGRERDSTLPARIGQVPYLNSGLFEREALDARPGIVVPDAVFRQAFDDLLYYYDFTVTESTPLDVEVAVDPEMLGRIFEALVTGRHETGSYYTPRPVVAFMCREALKGYLATACPREPAAAIAAFVDERDAAEVRDPERVLHALQTVRACDPATGSGAYLLGLLHELLGLRQALFHSRGIDARVAYNKKLEIIQNNLYGVDIDPFAVNIARLRLWLSLIVDFEGDVPPPLPNLAHRIEVGDSLSAPAPAQLQPDLFHYQLLQDYFALKRAYVTAHGAEEMALETRIAAIQQELSGGARLPGDSVAFDWNVAFAEVFTGTGATAGLPATAQEGWERGFDIVVTNPPYVRQELLTQAQKAGFELLYPEVYAGTADLYVYFYVRALHLLREGGVAAFISSNKWLRAGYGKKLRKLLAEQATVDVVVDFGDLSLFEATTYPMVVIFRKGRPAEGHALRALTVKDLGAVNRLAEAAAETAWAQPQADLAARGWVLVAPETRALLGKLRGCGVPLGELVDGQIHYGIKTGYNAAFVIEREARDRLVAADPGSAALIKPWLRGRDIRRWRVDWDGAFVIAIQSSGDAHAAHPWQAAATEEEAREIFRAAYPALHDHLSRYEPALRARSDQGAYWWELRACAYYGAFDSPKIVYPDIAKRCEFALDDRGHFGANTLYFIPSDDLVLLGILNSSVVSFFYRHISPMIQHDYLRFFSEYLVQVPIPTASPAQRQAIEGWVGQLLAAGGQGAQAAGWERELNAQVYALYDLTRDEIALIEGEAGG